MDDTSTSPRAFVGAKNIFGHYYPAFTLSELETESEVVHGRGSGSLVAAITVTDPTAKEKH